MRFAGAVFVLLICSGAAVAEELPEKDRLAIFEAAKSQGLTGFARKTRPVDARPAVPGETVVTVVFGEGVETTSKPAKEGDWVVRGRCLADTSANPEILVGATRFPERYGEAKTKPDASGYMEFLPKGVEMEYFIVSQDAGAFQFLAPWGTPMVAKPGDAIVQVPTDPNDTYRIARAEFDCTYEVTKPARTK